MLEEYWIGVCGKLVGSHKRDDFWILENQYDLETVARYS